MFNKLKNKYKFVYSENDSDNCHHREHSASLRRDIKLLERFRLQNTEAEASLIKDGWKFDISEIGDLERSKPRCFVEIDSSKFFALITMYSSGECEATVMNADSLDTIFFIYRVLDTEAEVSSFLQDFYGVLYEIQLSI